jgi:AcrR family transcriptional regulator
MDLRNEPVSRTQDERTAAMRARLMDATLAMILDCGYAGTTLVGIANRAGVTRGAVNHHYGSKDELVVDALSHHLRSASDEISELARSAHNGSLSIPDFLDKLWEIFSGPFFMITLEQITASRHNEFLKRRLVEATREFHRALDDTWNSFFASNGQEDPQLATILNATLCLLRGMGVQTVLRDDPAYYESLLSFWKEMLLKHTGVTLKDAQT